MGGAYYSVNYNIIDLTYLDENFILQVVAA